MREALAALPGVRDVEIDFEKQQAFVAVESTFSNPQKLVEALEDVGFGGSVIEDTSGDNPLSEQDEKPKPGLLDDNEPPEKSRNAFRRSAFNKHVTVTTHLDHNVFQPGDSFRVAVVVEVEDGWHIYGNPVGPGIGRATVISVQVPEGFQFEPARYAPAHKAEQDFGESGKTWVWVHTGKTIHYLSGHVSDDIPAGDYQSIIQVFGQVCTETTCLPGQAIVPLRIQIVGRNSPNTVTNSDLFVGFEKAKPAIVGAER